jgi:hypothetical protein
MNKEATQWNFGWQWELFFPQVSDTLVVNLNATA